jgi:hypothetical protein
MNAVLAVIAAVLQIIAYILKTRPTQSKTEVIQEIWANRKETRDAEIIKKQDDKLSMDAAAIHHGLEQLRNKTNPDDPGKH